MAERDFSSPLASCSVENRGLVLLVPEGETRLGSLSAWEIFQWRAWVSSAFVEIDCSVHPPLQVVVPFLEDSFLVGWGLVEVLEVAAAQWEPLVSQVLPASLEKKAASAQDFRAVVQESSALERGTVAGL